eukprot:snap_masked-scaffold_4-processed-gene-5.23-mRNA-1 protein AED:1.00 eAED:1.00 QI:0/-1/0/0/-1/1/1/0/208
MKETVLLKKSFFEFICERNFEYLFDESEFTIRSCSNMSTSTDIIFPKQGFAIKLVFPGELSNKGRGEEFETCLKTYMKPVMKIQFIIFIGHTCDEFFHFQEEFQLQKKLLQDTKRFYLFKLSSINKLPNIFKKILHYSKVSWKQEKSLEEKCKEVRAAASLIPIPNSSILMDVFGTLENVSQASVEDILAKTPLSSHEARSTWEFFHT